MKLLGIVSCILVFAIIALASPVGAQEPKTNAAKADRQYSGMYSFLKEGEFVQITVEDDGSVKGFVSRYGDGESDKETFIEQYFRSAKLEGNKLTFVTETVQAVWFDFKGTVEYGEGKNPGDEAYYMLKGTLTYNATDTGKKAITHPREVELKMFPKESH
jgi:hypothetical protein